MKINFSCAILGVSGDVQLHTWKWHMQKWVLVVLNEWNPFLHTRTILGDSADGLWCSTTYLEIAHAKMGVSGVGLLEAIFVCAILGDMHMEVFNSMLGNCTHENGWCCCISKAHFCVCDFGVVPLHLFQKFLHISHALFYFPWLLF